MHMYAELAPWWPLLSAPEDYEEEAAIYTRLMLEAAKAPIETVLELGSGGGNNASHMKARFKMTLVDLSPGMLEVSRRLNPECEHHQGDMRTVRLNREFDAVFIQDAVCYMVTEDDLRRAIETAAVHCKRGGVLLIAPDFVRENFRPGTDHGGHDGDGRSFRYLEWCRDDDPADDQYEVDYAFLIREGAELPRVTHDRHIEGLFSSETWLRLLGEAGIDARVIPFVHSEVDYEPVVFVGVRRL
jgi:SAM-dependent methyltransferase